MGGDIQRCFALFLWCVMYDGYTCVKLGKHACLWMLGHRRFRQKNGTRVVITRYVVAHKCAHILFLCVRLDRCLRLQRWQRSAETLGGP